MFKFLEERKKRREMKWKRQTAYSALSLLQRSIDAAQETEVVASLALADNPEDECAHQQVEAARSFMNEAGLNVRKLVSNSPRLIDEGVEYTCTHGFYGPVYGAVQGPVLREKVLS